MNLFVLQLQFFADERSFRIICMEMAVTQPPGENPKGLMDLNLPDINCFILGRSPIRFLYLPALSHLLKEKEKRKGAQGSLLIEQAIKIRSMSISGDHVNNVINMCFSKLIPINIPSVHQTDDVPRPLYVQRACVHL